MTDRLDAALWFPQRVLALRAERQQVLASNITNADTPDYKARDFDFRSALTAAISAASPAAMASSHPLHLSTSDTGTRPDSQPLQYRIPRQDSIDGNTVEIDTERAQFADNAVHYEAGLSDLNAKLKGLLAVIQGN